MSRLSSLKLLPGLLAVGIYLLLIGLLAFYFNTHTEKKSKNFVKKDEHRIQVAFSNPQSSKEKSKPKKQPKSKVKKSVPKKPKPQVKKRTEKRVIKEKIVKKKKVVKKVSKKKKPKKKKSKKRNNTKDLFANVKTAKKKNIIKMSDKPFKSKPKNNLIKIKDKPKTASERINHSLKNKKSARSGVENAYLAKVQRLLEGWPAQSEFAGEKVKVILHIRQSGFFDFKIKRASSNPNFNRALTEYLEQLQEFGFGPHKGGRTYHFEAEFLAKE